MRTDSPDNTALKCKNMVFLTKNFNPAPNKYFLAQCKLEFKSDLEKYYNPSYNKKADVDIVVVYVGILLFMIIYASFPPLFSKSLKRSNTFSLYFNLKDLLFICCNTRNKY